MVCCLKDFRRIATRYDTPPNYLSAVVLAAAIAVWTYLVSIIASGTGSRIMRAAK